ncbi:MAG: signal recognition particle protein, partial [Verrucomicrobiota bacterium]
EQMMQEVVDIKAATEPDEVLFVVDSMTGQDAVNTAKAFNERLDVDGIVLTKLDGDTRGGAALSIRSVVQKPIKFASTGEKVDDFDVFHPDRMAQRILGMGDVVSLVEKAQETIDEQDAEKMAEKLRRADFNFADMLQQFRQVKKMGNLGSLMGMMPGMSRMKFGDEEERKMARTEAIILSMTPQERENPRLLNGSRRLRIANGSGVAVRDVNALIKQHGQMRKMMRMMKGKKGRRMMEQMKGQGMGGLPGMGKN